MLSLLSQKDGTVESPEILRGLGGGVDEEVLRVVNLMNSLPAKWTPGKQRGKNVKVQFTLPVRFALDNEDKADDTDPEDGEDAEPRNEPQDEPQKQGQLAFDKMDLYPNPSTGTINIDVKTKTESPTTMVITDATGKEVYKKLFPTKVIKVSDLNLNHAANGILFISFEQDGKIATKEVVLQR